MTTRTFFRSTVLALGALVAFATPSFADGPNRGPRGDRQEQSNFGNRNDRDRDGRGDHRGDWNNRGDRDNHRHGGWTTPGHVWSTPVVHPRPHYRIPTGVLVVSNPFGFPVKVFVNGEPVGRLGAFDQMRVPGVRAGSASVSLQNRRRVVLSEQVWVRANSRNAWRPFVPRHNRYAAGW